MKLNIRAFALSCGLVWGVGLFVLTWWIIMLGGIGTEIFPLTYIYPGYYITPVGSLVGMVWAFIDGLIGGAVFAWLYNVFVRA
ncbi:MAG: bacteriophage holin [Desulfomonilia bacterium]